MARVRRQRIVQQHLQIEYKARIFTLGLVCPSQSFLTESLKVSTSKRALFFRSILHRFGATLGSILASLDQRFWAPRTCSKPRSHFLPFFEWILNPFGLFLGVAMGGHGPFGGYKFDFRAPSISNPV